MLIRNSRIKSLLLAIISLNVGYTYATGVTDIISDATTDEISAAKENLVTPTLGLDSAYQLVEVVGDVEESDFTITKYLYNAETYELTAVNYNVVFNEVFGDSTGDTYLYYKWEIDDSGNRVMVSSDVDDADVQSLVDWDVYDSKIGRVIGAVDVTSVVGNFVDRSVDYYNGAAITNGVGFDISYIIGDFHSNDVSSSIGPIYGGAIYNAGEIGNITGDFTKNDAYSYSLESVSGGNYVYSRGGAIANNGGSIDNIFGSFTSNVAKSYIGDTGTNYQGNALGGALYNSGTIGSLIGDFINNVALVEDVAQNAIADWAYALGGAIGNSGGKITEIVGDFISNYTYSGDYTWDSYCYGGAVFNENGSIGSINGDFIGNYSSSHSFGYAVAAGGAIYNTDGEIGDIDGSFVGNYAEAIGVSYTVGVNGLYASGGAIYNEGEIGDITGDFISNYAYTSYTYYSKGGAIYNEGVIGDITGDFIDNYCINGNYTYGGAIYNLEASIGTITGDFINNYAVAINFSYGGAIYNDSGSIGDIFGSFINNYVSGSSYIYGGAIYSTGSIGSIIGDFYGNYICDGVVFVHGGAIYNMGTIDYIAGDFCGNYVSGTGYCRGGAIYNGGSIELLESNFTNNFVTGTNKARGGAISNYDYIGAIVGDFTGNYVTSVSTSSGSNSGTYGGAIYNECAIGSITGNFFGNYAYTFNGGAGGGAIYNTGTINQIVGDFSQNNVTNTASSSYGGAIANSGDIDCISGSFSENSAICSDKYTLSYGGAIYNTGTINNINGDFSANSAIGYRGLGGAIANDGEIGNITGNFIANEAIYTGSSGYSYGGAIYNSGTISSITGDFIGNSALSTDIYDCNGGAIYNSGGFISAISGDFVGNSAYQGGAVYNYIGSLEFIALNQDMQFLGNYSTLNGSSSTAIYNKASSSESATISFNAYDAYQITINDGINGYGTTAYAARQILNINQAEGATSVVSFNNSVSYQTINVYQGSLNLGEYEGGTIMLSGIDADEDGVDDTMEVSASSALLTKCVLNIEESGTVNTKADYLGSGNTLTNLGTLNITGGTLSQTITGTGITNLFGDVSSSSTRSVAEGSTLNNYGTFTGNLSIGTDADVNAIITSDNLGKTIFNGSISGITNIDVSFDLAVDLNDVVGITTTVYADESDDISLTLVDSDHISGASVVGNTVVVSDEVVITTADYTATATKDGDSTNIDVTTGSFEIAEGITQTLSSITTGEDATLVISGGTLVTDNDLALANDDATSGVKADSGVIESTATVELSEGTTSVASGATLEVKAELNLTDDTQATFGSSDASLVLQKDITLGENSVLTLDGNISGSANIIGNGTATINYTGVFSPGNSPELVSYTDTTVNYMGGSILEMEIFGEAGAGVEGGHDKIVFYGCNVSFGGTIQLNIDDVASLMGEEQSKTITIDLFDFEGGTSIVSFDADLDLVYDSNGWFVIADTSNLLTTGEVSLSISAIPEPSTATLSLLALAGMLARRRRKAA